MGYNKKRAEKDIRKAGGYLVRHGSRHDIWEVNGVLVELPRHEGRDLSKKVRDDINVALHKKPSDKDKI